MTWHGRSLSLLTDLYQLTMAQAYWKAGLTETEAVFHMFYRRKPFKGGYAVAAGLESVIDYIESLAFSDSDIAYLKTLQGGDGSPLFDEAFLRWLHQLPFSCDVDAIPEGTLVFPYEPLVRVSGPLIQCQLLETPLLNLINFPTLIATKAARVCQAAAGDTVFEFGLRRAQGVDGAIAAARACYIGGCHGTSNVLAGKLFGIPVRGTHAHSWVQVFDSELEAFQTYAETSPNNCVLLVDTFDSVQGVKHAIAVGKKLREQGHHLQGIRLDSGDLAYLSRIARSMLDAEGFQETKIVASNELDEVVINELKRQGALIDVWGVGTNLITGNPQPALDGVYKLSAVREPDQEWQYRLKLSEQMVKTSNPGFQQVRRYYDSNNRAIADALYDPNLVQLDEGCTIVDPLDATRQKKVNGAHRTEDLLVPVYKQGQLVYDKPNIEEIRQRVQEQLAQFHSGIKRFLNPHEYVVGMEQSLYELKISLVKHARQQQLSK